MINSNVRVGFIGFGNMGSAICDGLIKAEAVDNTKIFACANTWDKLVKATSERGINACKSPEGVVNNADLIIVAVKPYMVRNILEPLKYSLSGKLVVSIAAGCNSQFFSEFLPDECNYIATMPNTPVSICEGVLLCEENHTLSDEQFSAFMKIFSSIAVVELIESKVFSAAGSISGCGPAFVAMLIEALGDAGVKYGLKRDVAYRLAAQVASGTGALHIATGTHPAAMKDAVCSPGGTTIRGVSALEESGFRSALIKAIDEIEGK